MSIEEHFQEFGAYRTLTPAGTFDARQWGDLKHISRLAMLFMVGLADSMSITTFKVTGG